MTVAGRAVDAASGTPVPFATVTVLRDGVAVGGELTDEAGRFVLEGLQRGNYTVSVGFVGYVPADTALLVGERNDNYDLGDLLLAHDESVTDEIIVTPQRQVLEASFDRRVFDLGEDTGLCGRCDARLARSSTTRTSRLRKAPKPRDRPSI